MRNAIPLAIAYARNVRATENHSFQKWLQEKIDREDLIWWARKEEERELRPDTTEPVKENWMHKITALIP